MQAELAVDAIGAAINLAEQRAEFERALNQARRAYWTSVDQGQPSNEAGAQYASLLHQKDMYYLWLRLYDDNAGDAEPGVRRNEEMGLGDALQFLSGGKLDGGIHESASLSYDAWAAAIIRSARNRIMGGGPNTSPTVQSYGQAILSELNDPGHHDLRDAYLRDRDTAEFLFANPRSPLKSRNNETFLAAWLVTAKALPDFPSATSYVEELQSLVPARTFGAAVEDLRDQELIEWWNRQRARWGGPSYLRYALDRVDYRIAAEDPELLALFLLKKRFMCSWSDAKVIREIRIERHGEPAFRAAEIAVAQQMSEFEAPEQAYNDPYHHRRPKEIEPIVGLHEAWRDLYHVGQSQQVGEAESEQLSELLLGKLSPEERDFVLERIPLSLLLIAATGHQRFDATLLVGRRAFGPPRAYIPEAGLHLGTITAMKGIAIILEDPSLFAAMDQIRWDANPEANVGRLLYEALTRFDELEETFGRERLLDAAAQLKPRATVYEDGRYIFPPSVRRTPGSIREYLEAD